LADLLPLFGIVLPGGFESQGLLRPRQIRLERGVFGGETAHNLDTIVEAEFIFGHRDRANQDEERDPGSHTIPLTIEAPAFARELSKGTVPEPAVRLGSKCYLPVHTRHRSIED